MLILPLLLATASILSVFVFPSSELWAGAEVEVGCYTGRGRRVVWTRRPLAGGQEELVAHQEHLLLEGKDGRMVVEVEDRGERQVSRIKVGATDIFIALYK